jgi:hypothetical protein
MTVAFCLRPARSIAAFDVQRRHRRWREIVFLRLGVTRNGLGQVGGGSRQHEHARIMAFSFSIINSPSNPPRCLFEIARSFQLPRRFERERDILGIGGIQRRRVQDVQKRLAIDLCDHDQTPFRFAMAKRIPRPAIKAKGSTTT